MMVADDFRIAIIAPFPHPHVIHEGWMSRISSIDEQLKGLVRIYLNFSEEHDDSRCNEIRHDEERAEVFLNPLGKNSAAFVSDLAASVDAFYVHTLHLVEHMLPWLRTGKVFVDIHGITPEEEELLGNVHLRERYEAVEREVLQGAKCCICVSRAMIEHYTKKYPLLTPKWLIIPVSVPFSAAPGAAGNPSDDDRPSVLYSGGVQKWQNLDAMLTLAESAGEEMEFRFLSHEHIQIRQRIDALRMARPPSVGYCRKTELPAAYGAADFGLILRDDSPVNRVSCPTKLVEYLSFGLVPVVRSPHIGDFYKLGFAYVTEEEFHGGFVPDSASRDWMAEQNLHVVEQQMEQFHAGIRELRAIMLDGLVGRNDHDKGVYPAKTIASADLVDHRPEYYLDLAKVECHEFLARKPILDSKTEDDVFFHDLTHFRRSVLDQHIVFPCRVLEVGAFNAPTIDPSEAEVKFLDYYTTEELESMARTNGGDLTPVVSVDYVCRTDNYNEVVSETFDVLIANHVLEHIDHTIRWLQMVRSLIRDDGFLFVVLPDKKKSFDRFRPDTSFSHLLFEHLVPEQDASSIHNLETALYYDQSYIGENNDPATRLDLENLSKAITSSHPGIHRHVFQYETFAEKILNPLLYIGLIDFRLLEIVNCPQFGEFAIILKAGKEGMHEDPSGIFTPATDSLPFIDTRRSE